MLTCKELAQQHASAHIDEELRGSLRWSMRLHLVMCSNCRRFVAQMKTVKALLNDKAGAELRLSESETKALVKQFLEQAKGEK